MRPDRKFAFVAPSNCTCMAEVIHSHSVNTYPARRWNPATFSS